MGIEERQTLQSATCLNGNKVSLLYYCFQGYNLKSVASLNGKLDFFLILSLLLFFANCIMNFFQKFVWPQFVPYKSMAF